MENSLNASHDIQPLKMQKTKQLLGFGEFSEGRMHDARMLAASSLFDELENFAFSPTRTEMCHYGDPAYPLRF